ncbi:MAG TPA: hypothetical protein VF142_06865 [Longimicrobium sp.]
MRYPTSLSIVAALLLGLGSGGCMTAAVAGAGAGAALAYDDRGVSTRMQGSVDGVFARAQAVFREMGITETAQDNDGDERELKGQAGNGLEITVDIEAESESMVSVGVFAQRNTVNWDREYARSVMERIMAR